MTTRKINRLGSMLLALALAVPSAGCDWLDPSGSSSRLSPVIGALTILPPSVFCGEGSPLRIAFEYSDPQNDIQQLMLTFQHAGQDERFSRTVSWADPPLNLATSGRAVYSEFFFECGGPSAGDWSVTVQLEDQRGHLSNELEGSVILVSTR